MGNLKPLFLNLCLRVFSNTFDGVPIISAIRVTVHELIIKPITGWVVLIDDQLKNQTDSQY